MRAVARMSAAPTQGTDVNRLVGSPGGACSVVGMCEGSGVGSSKVWLSCAVTFCAVASYAVASRAVVCCAILSRGAASGRNRERVAFA